MIGGLLRAAREAFRAAVVVPELDTSGGDDDLADESPDWDGGWYLGARRAPIHPGRMGRGIQPWLTVVHTTDMHPGDATYHALVRAWQRSAGRGAGAHFLVGRGPSTGLTQLTPVDRNGQHAGGPGGQHGWTVVAGRRRHPNSVAIGIEVHCAGAVRRVDGAWRYGGRDDDGVWRPEGAPIHPGEVEPDPARPGRGWQRATTWQLEQLEQLLGALGRCPVMVPAPAAWAIDPHGTPGPWAPRVVIGGRPVVGHVTLDPRRKLDPWPPISGALRAMAVAR